MGSLDSNGRGLVWFLYSVSLAASVLLAFPGGLHRAFPSECFRRAGPANRSGFTVLSVLLQLCDTHVPELG
jgi:hypothetical protein